MSHFTLLVTLDKDVDLSHDENGDRPGLNFALDQALERFSENREVEPYRDYLDGGPGDFWWVDAARRERDHYLNGTGLKKHDPGMIGWSSVSSKLTHDQQRAEQLGWKKWADRLDSTVRNDGVLSWLDVIGTYESWKRESGDSSESIYYDKESDRVYTIDTYNPQSKWDWWVIGGRWAGKFHAITDAPTPDVFSAKGGKWNNPKYDSWDGRIDGGRARYVDIERCRVDAATTAFERYELYRSIAVQHPAALPWRSFLDRIDAGELDMSDARAAYREQPLVKALNEVEQFKFSWDCVIEDMSIPVEEYVADARRDAVTCYAMITKEDEWVAPGEMGWFGMSDDTASTREAYDVKVNEYVDALNPDDVIVILDLHI